MTNIEKIVREIKTKNKKYADRIVDGQVVYFINEKNEVCRGIVTGKYLYPDANSIAINHNDCIEDMPYEDVYIFEEDAKTVVYAEDYMRLQRYVTEIKDKDTLIKFMFKHCFTENQEWTAKLAIRQKAKEFGLDITD